MKAFLILEDGNVFTGTSIGSTREVISEIVFNTSMTGYLEVLTDPSYAGQAVVMTYPLIGNYGITPDMESCARRNIRNASVYSFSDGCSSAHFFYCKNENERIDDMCSFLYDRDCSNDSLRWNR